MLLCVQKFPKAHKLEDKNRYIAGVPPQIDNRHPVQVALPCADAVPHDPTIRHSGSGMACMHLPAVKGWPEFSDFLSRLQLLWDPADWSVSSPTPEWLFDIFCNMHGISKDERKNYYLTPNLTSTGTKTFVVNDREETMKLDLVSRDLDVNGNRTITDAVDGAENYLPGSVGTPGGGYNNVLSDEQNGYTGQLMTLVVDGAGVDSRVDKLTFRITDVTNHEGYCENATSISLQGEGKTDDFSFKKTGNDRKITIDSSSTPSTSPSYGGRMETDKTWVYFWAKDYGGSCTVEVSLKKEDGTEITTLPALDIPQDEDDDGIADRWEERAVTEWNNQYDGVSEPVGNEFFSPSDDKEKKDPDGRGPLAEHKDVGDGLTVLHEYRGFDFHSVGAWGGEQNYVRLSPAKKELLVEVDRSVDREAPTVAAPRGEVKSAMTTAKSAFLRSAGVELYYVVDNIVAPKASFTTYNQMESYAASNYDTTNETDSVVLDRSRYVYLLFAFQIGPESDRFLHGLADEKWNGAIIACNPLHDSIGGANATSRFNSLYSISIEEKMGATVTHELGHTVQCSGDTVYYYGTPALRVRMRPTYYPEEPAVWGIEEVGNQFQAQLEPEKGVVDLGMDLYANANVTLADVENGINALTNKYEADASTMYVAQKGWRLERGPGIIEHFADGSASKTWSEIRIQADVTSVMTYNRSVDRYKNVHFNNDATSNPEVYNDEIGGMDVKSNYSKVNYP